MVFIHKQWSTHTHSTEHFVYTHKLAHGSESVWKAIITNCMHEQLPSCCCVYARTSSFTNAHSSSSSHQWQAYSHEAPETRCNFYCKAKEEGGRWQSWGIVGGAREMGRRREWARLSERDWDWDRKWERVMGKEGILEKRGKSKKVGKVVSRPSRAQNHFRKISFHLSPSNTPILALSASLPSPTTFLHAKCIILPEAQQAAFIIFHNTLHAFPLWNS